MSSAELARAEDDALLAVARRSVESGLREGRPPEIDPVSYAPALREPGACFVTLRSEGELRGCTGTLEANRALVCAVASCAYRSAYRDPRFPPVEGHELDRLGYHISLLGPLEPLLPASESELLARLRPGVDGLVVHEGSAAGTFLPAVWESLPEPADFLRELLRKAGLRADPWSGTLRFRRFQVREIG